MQITDFSAPSQAPARRESARSGAARRARTGCRAEISEATSMKCQAKMMALSEPRAFSISRAFHARWGDPLAARARSGRSSETPLKSQARESALPATLWLAPRRGRTTDKNRSGQKTQEKFRFRHHVDTWPIGFGIAVSTPNRQRDSKSSEAGGSDRGRRQDAACAPQRRTVVVVAGLKRRSLLPPCWQVSDGTFFCRRGMRRWVRGSRAILLRPYGM